MEEALPRPSHWARDVSAGPPITFSASFSQGYNSNILSADSHIVPTPTPIPGPTPPLEARIIAFRIQPPYPPTPVFQLFRPTPRPTPKISTSPPPGVIGTGVSSFSVGSQLQMGSPRAEVTADLSVGESDTWNRPGPKSNYTGSSDLQLVCKLTPRATLSISENTTYQNTPNFSLVNAPTNAGQTGTYLDGGVNINLSYGWTARLSTVTSYSMNFNLLNSIVTQNLLESIYGTQFRYTVSPRTTITAELRGAAGAYPSNPIANDGNTYYLLGMDTNFSSKLRNTFSTGIEVHTLTKNGVSETLPYFESDTTLAMPRFGGLTWTNYYGSQESQIAGQSITSYRTGLSYGQPLSTKLSASLSVAYNVLQNTFTSAAAASSRQKQFQASVSLNYTLSPRLSMSLSYTYLDLLSTVINSSYQDDQVFLSGSYRFR